MLYTIAVILLVLWLLGLVTSYTVGGFIHILLVVAVIMVLVTTLVTPILLRVVFARKSAAPAPEASTVE